MHYKEERRCTNCKLKPTCNTFKNVESEKTVSGWDLNRFATCCIQYKEKEETNDTKC